MMEGKQKVALTFALYQNEALVRRETVTQDIVKVGKDAKSHLRVDDELASRMHAVIEVASPDDITLIDLGNEPGTMVNGARVNKCKINPGDQLQIGGTKIVLERAEPVAVAAAAGAKGPGASPFAAPAAPSSNPFGAPGPLVQRRAPRPERAARAIWAGRAARRREAPSTDRGWASIPSPPVPLQTPLLLLLGYPTGTSAAFAQPAATASRPSM